MGQYGGNLIDAELVGNPGKDNWLEIQPVMNFTANGQVAIALSQVNHDHPAQQIFAAPPVLAAVGPLDNLEPYDTITRRLAA